MPNSKSIQAVGETTGTTSDGFRIALPPKVSTTKKVIGDMYRTVLIGEQQIDVVKLQ